MRSEACYLSQEDAQRIYPHPKTLEERRRAVATLRAAWGYDARSPEPVTCRSTDDLPKDESAQTS